MRLTVLGSGYVGLVTAAGLSELGHSVLAVDIDAARVELLRSGRVPFYEPGLDDIVLRNVRAGRLSFSTRIDDTFAESNVYFIAVGTPPNADGSADTSAVFAAAHLIARTARAPAVIATKSTVPVGTGDAIEADLPSEARARLAVVSNPEFLKEGAAVDDFFRPDRVLVGVQSEAAERAMRDLYRPLQLSSERLLVTDRRSAELSKYAANAMLAIRISFMNELARLCDKVGADVSNVRRAIGSDHRIGPQFLYSGPGFGGSCFPKDTRALSSTAERAGLKLEVVDAAIRANEAQPNYVIERLTGLLEGRIAGTTIALWGLAFKAETDDVRESPAGAIASRLLSLGVELRLHDPVAAENFKKAFAPNASYFDSEYDAAEGADAVVLMTEWRHLRNPDFDRLKANMKQPVLFDTRNIWTAHRPWERGFRYRGIGVKGASGSRP